MSGIRVPVISQIVSLGIKKGVGDMSPYVRRAAALAVPKCYRLDPGTGPQLVEYLGTLLGDREYFVAGAAVAAFLEVCPDRIDLVHMHYRGLVRKLVDMDEWGQLATLRLLMVYARKCFPRRTRRVRRGGESTKSKSVGRGFYDDEPTEEKEEDDNDSNYEEVVLLDPDLEHLLNASRPLLQSRNSAVILAVARLYFYLGTPPYLQSAIGPLISLLRSPPDIQHLALHNIVQVCLAHPHLFVPYTSHFLLKRTDTPSIQTLKLELLTLVFPHSAPSLQSLILAELSHFAKSHSTALVRASVRAIGRCATRSTPATASRCLHLLLAHLSSQDTHLVAESLEVVRHLIQRDPPAHISTVIRLAKNLDGAQSAQARASIVWLVGEFAALVPSEEFIAADVLRILMKGFADEEVGVQAQIVLLAAKVYLGFLNGRKVEEGKKERRATSPPLRDSEAGGLDLPGDEDGGFRDHVSEAQSVGPTAEGEEQKHAIELLWQHVLLLARYSTSYDLRDRTRLYRALLSTPSSTELASLLLLAPKPVPTIPSPSESRKGYVLGSASLVVGDEGGVGGLRGYEALPEWVKEGEEPDPRLRDEAGSGGRTEYERNRVVPASEMLDTAAADRPVAVKANGVRERNLDDWLAEGEEGDDDDEEDEADEEDDGTEEETETEEGTSEEESEESSSEDEGERDRLVK